MNSPSSVNCQSSTGSQTFSQSTSIGSQTGSTNSSPREPLLIRASTVSRVHVSEKIHNEPPKQSCSTSAEITSQIEDTSKKGDEQTAPATLTPSACHMTSSPTTSVVGSCTSIEERLRTRRGESRRQSNSSRASRLRRSTFTRSLSDISTSGSIGSTGSLEYPCTPELLLDAHKRKHFLDPCEEWLVLELNEYECLIDNIQIVRVCLHSAYRAIGMLVSILH